MSAGLTVENIDEFQSQYRERRKGQMLKFFGFSIVTLLLCKRAMGVINASKYIPKYFELNHLKSNSSIDLKKNLMNGMLYSTGITVGLFGMVANGSCWIWDISNLQEFRKYKGLSGSVEEMNESRTKKITNMPLLSDEMELVYNAVNKVQ